MDVMMMYVSSRELFIIGFFCCSMLFVQNCKNGCMLYCLSVNSICVINIYLNGVQVNSLCQGSILFGVVGVIVLVCFIIFWIVIIVVMSSSVVISIKGRFVLQWLLMVMFVVVFSSCFSVCKVFIVLLQCLCCFGGMSCGIRVEYGVVVQLLLNCISMKLSMYIQKFVFLVSRFIVVFIIVSFVMLMFMFRCR